MLRVKMNNLVHKINHLHFLHLLSTWLYNKLHIDKNTKNGSNNEIVYVLCWWQCG